MFESSDYRYDPLYKVLDTTPEVDIVEKKLLRKFNRLKGIENLGIIPIVFETAHYSKYEHALGTTHQIINLLEVAEKSDESVRDHRLALIVSALFLHLGHCPFTYSTERALLLASTFKGQSAESEARDFITKKVRIALKPKEDVSEAQVQQMIDQLFERQDHTTLYKYFAAALLVNKCTVLKKNLKNFDEEKLREAVSNLLDKTSDGYKYLELADTVDYVQRDALHFGAVGLDISPKHLFGRFLNIKPSTSDEKKLIDYNIYECKLLKVSLDYLDERFYKIPQVVWFSALYKKVMACLISHPSFDLRWLEECNDDEFKHALFGGRHKSNKGQKPPKEWIKRAQDLLNNRFKFDEIIAVHKVEFPEAKNGIDVERKLVKLGKSATSFLAYPFDRGILSVVQDNETDHQGAPDRASSYSVKLFQDRSNRDLLPLLEFVQRLAPYLAPEQWQEIRRGLATQITWSRHIRFDSGRIPEVLTETIKQMDNPVRPAKKSFTKSLIERAASVPTFGSAKSAKAYNVLEHLLPLFPPEDMTDALESLKYSRAVQCLLFTPVKFLQYKSMSKLIEEISTKLANRLAEETGNKGNIFETLCILDRICSKKGVFQFFLYGAIVRDEEQRKDETEFDIIEFIIHEKKVSECCIYACSISDEFRKNNIEHVTEITSHIHRVFKKAVVRSYYLVPENKSVGDWRPKLEQTGRNFNT
jgi:HD superfamily phosphohydrolase